MGLVLFYLNCVLHPLKHPDYKQNLNRPAIRRFFWYFHCLHLHGLKERRSIQEYLSLTQRLPLRCPRSNTYSRYHHSGKMWSHNISLLLDILQFQWQSWGKLLERSWEAILMLEWCTDHHRMGCNLRIHPEPIFFSRRER